MTASKDPRTVAIELLRDDDHAASFQSLGQYRSALLNALSAQSTASPDPVVEANREMLLQRSLVGLKKYRVTLADGGLSLRERLHHALEEALDLSNYMQAAISAIDAGALTAPRAAADGEREAWALRQIARLDPKTDSIGTAIFMAKETLARAALSQPAKEQEACGTCHGRGLVGGMMSYGDGQVDMAADPCPDCVQQEAKPEKHVLPESVLQEMCDVIEGALLSHRLSELVEEDDPQSGYPLLDHLSHDRGTETGKREIEMVAESIYYALREAYPAAPPQAEAKPDFSKYVTLEAYQQAMRNWLEQAEAQSKDGQIEGGRG